MSDGAGFPGAPVPPFNDDRAGRPFVILLAPSPAQVHVEVRGEVDLRTAPQLAAVLEAAIATGPAGVVLDLTAVDFLDAKGLGVLVRSAELCRPGRLRIVGAGPVTVRLIEMFSLDQLFDLEPRKGA